jgi:hypothetical protein
LAVALFVVSAAGFARADVVLDRNAIAVSTMASQNPLAQARTAAIVQTAVFEAVNATTRDYEAYLDSVVAAPGASAEAAAVAAAHRVLVTYFPGSAATLDTARAASLAAIPDGRPKNDGITAGEAAAAAMMALRAADGAAPPQFYAPSDAVPGAWQATPTCPINPSTGERAGVFLNWGSVTPFGIPNAAAFRPEPPPELASSAYRKAYEEVMAVGGVNSVARPLDRSDVARFYGIASPTYVWNVVARQLAADEATISENARALALVNMAISDGLVASMATKYHYAFWRPETAIRAGDTDGNPRTDADPGFTPYIATPCFPSYPSNHGSASSAAAEVLRRLYGALGHDLSLSSPLVPDVALHYTTLRQITDDVDDARVYGGIHFRFDQEVGSWMGRAVATFVYRHNLRRAHRR